MPELRHYAPGVPVILVGTKADLKHDSSTLAQLKARGESVVTIEEGQELARNLYAIKYVETSAYSGENLKAVFDEAVKAVLLRTRPGRHQRHRKHRCFLM